MSQDTNTGNATPDENGAEGAGERKYSASEEKPEFTRSQMEQIVDKRLTKDRKDRRIATEEPKPVKQGVNEDDLRGKLTKVETDYKGIADRLERMRNDNLRTVIEKKLAVDFNVVDPDLLADRFISKGMVKYDDDDAITVDGGFDSLDELIKSELEKRPYLVKSTAKGGAGMKAPGAVKAPSTVNIANMTSEQFAAFKQEKYGYSPQTANKNWFTG